MQTGFKDWQIRNFNNPKTKTNIKLKFEIKLLTLSAPISVKVLECSFHNSHAGENLFQKSRPPPP